MFKGDVELESQSIHLTEKMLNAVTISGSGTRFEAITCEQYVRKRWGNIGTQVATFLTEAAKLVSFGDDGNVIQARIQTVEREKLDYESESPSDLIAYAFPSHVCLFVQNLVDSQVQEIQDIAQWMCQTFRPLPSKLNEPGALRMSGLTQPADLYLQAEFKTKVFRLLSLKPFEIHRAGCWTALFEAGIGRHRDELRSYDNSSRRRDISLPPI